MLTEPWRTWGKAILSSCTEHHYRPEQLPMSGSAGVSMFVTAGMSIPGHAGVLSSPHPPGEHRRSQHGVHHHAGHCTQHPPPIPPSSVPRQRAGRRSFAVFGRGFSQAIVSHSEPRQMESLRGRETATALLGACTWGRANTIRCADDGRA